MQEQRTRHAREIASRTRITCARRYETASTVLTSNEGVEEWGEILGCDGGGADCRVLHHCHLVNIRGNSYRMREHTELHRALQSDVESSGETVRPSGRGRLRAGTEAKRLRI
jgi:hypothetical protein